MKPIIEVNHLSKKYKIGQKQEYYTLRDMVSNPFKSLKEKQEEFWALKDVSFTVNKGEVLGVIGANGAGKSTLLKILSRITPPTEGEVVMRGRVASLLEVGTGFHQELTGRENIYLNGSILGMTKKEIDQKFDEIVKFAEIGKFLDTPIKHYSSGMKVKLAFSVAVHLEPEILLVDEVLAVGDIAFQRKSLNKMKEASSKKNRVVLFVSHNIASIRQLCHKGILINEGKVEVVGPIEKVISRYKELIFKTSDLEKSIMTPDFSINKISIINRQNKVSNSVEYGESFSTHLSYQANPKKINNIKITIRFDSIETGMRCVTLRSQYINKNHKIKTKGEIVVNLKENHMTPGSYWITVFIDYQGKVISQLERVGSFIVLPKEDEFTSYPNPIESAYLPKFTINLE